mmetsp:Transcript_110466/g.276543  ORF Transcript_110466/g.276543 Transcript_110466/m.276543 type:complete len:302 (+) Transcript_110466:68-973(+)
MAFSPGISRWCFESSLSDASSSDVGAAAPGEHSRRVCRLGAREMGFTIAAALAGSLIAASLQARHSTLRLHSAKVESEISVAAMPSPSPGPLNHWWTDVPGEKAASSTAADVVPVQGASTPEPDWFGETGAAGAGGALAPKATMNDGNACADDEEEYSGLCYKKCSALTYGQYPVRSSAWTCCKKEPCTLLNSRHNIGICSGFDVAGDIEGRKACPHVVGTCLIDEEVHIGMCYKKCSLLAPEYPNRFGPETCCKVRGLSCALPSNSVTGSKYAVGGGTGDNDPSTPDEPHKPLKSLTESD